MATGRQPNVRVRVKAINPIISLCIHKIINFLIINVVKAIFIIKSDTQ